MNANQIIFTGLLFFSMSLANAQKKDPQTKTVEEKKAPVTEVHTIVDELPEFPGGTVALQEFIKTNIQYPAAVMSGSLTGMTFTRFVVKVDGSIEDIDIVKHMPGCKDCDEEAIRLLILMPKWKPGKIKGKPVNSIFNLPFSFKPLVK
ncbi:MAG: energy transducer TonB [Bacteroidota bacterium]